MSDDARRHPKDFTLDGYRRLISAILSKGYVVRSFVDAIPKSPHLILRHDIDFDLEAAVALAEAESKLGVTSTYFLLLRTEFYNPFSGSGMQAVRKLERLGHNVGLHFDASLYDDEDTNLVAALENECHTMEQVTGSPITVFSLHRPSRDELDRDLIVPGRTNAYERRYFREMGYCSDSRGDWHHGHPLEHPAVEAGRALQLLTHPIWWVGEENSGVQSKLQRVLEQRSTLLERETAAHCSAFQPLDRR